MTSVGRSFLVALGGYLVVIAAIVTAVVTVPARPTGADECTIILGCLSPAQGILFILLLSAPVLVVLSLITVFVCALLARRLPSSIVTGLAAAGLSMGITAGLGALWAALR